MINIEDLWVRYYGLDDYTLKGISAKIGNGLTLVVGPTGSGKSTLARVLVGLIPHFYFCDVKGSISIFGVNPIEEGTKALAGIVGYVPQLTELFIVSVLVEEELIFPMSNLAVPPREMVERLNNVVYELGIEDLLNKTTLSLSSGQLQLVAIASTLIMKPKVLIMDEPFSRLDPNNRMLVARILERLSKRMIVIIFDHHIDEIYPSVNRVIILENGKITAMGDPWALINRVMEITDFELSILGDEYVINAMRVLYGNAKNKRLMV